MAKAKLASRRHYAALWQFLLGLCILCSAGAGRSFAQGFSIGADASNYALLFEGAGANTLQITNVTVIGNVGVGLTGKATDSGPSTVNGRFDFSAANSGQFSSNNAGNVITGGVNYNVAAVTSALNAVNALNASLGGLSGTNININGSMTISAGAGISDGKGDRVFNVTGFNTTNSDQLKIQGDAAGDKVIFNFIGVNANFNNQVVLTGGLNADDVLWNFVGGSNLTGGPTLQINDNASSNAKNQVQGIFLDPNGAISITNANVHGRVFGGDTHDFQYVSGATISQPSAIPEPSSIMLVGFGGVGLAAVLARRRRALVAFTHAKINS
ncbi:MAG TPA: collagen-binding domain-containing protein [Gemmataceae bacterium]|nr:collagen-binding domain-containing protein [Gemmataceae bacterium]